MARMVNSVKPSSPAMLAKVWRKVCSVAPSIPANRHTLAKHALADW
jgi:hypothetical protein